jgi:protein-disulfide isomerase
MAGTSGSMTPRHRRAAVALFILAVLGVLDTAYLVLEHIHVRSAGGGSAACDINERFNCAAAALSSYSELAGIPIAGLGLSYYLGLALLAVLAVSERRRVIAPLLVGLTALASSYSLFLLGVSVTRLAAICPACSVTYVVNLATFIAALIMATPSLGESFKTLAAHVGEALAPLGAFAVIVIAGTAGATVFVQARIATSPPVAVTPPAPTAPPPLSPAEVTAIAHAAYAPSMGPASANVLLVVFSDFECPHCARFAATLRRLHRNYGDALRVEYRSYPLPMHKTAELAARWAVCAERQGKFWGFHDLLFEKQDELDPESLPEIADDAGVDPRSAMTCADTPDVRQIVAADIAAGEKLGIEGTPAFVLNGEVTVGAMLYDDLEQRIGKLLQSTERAQLAP